MSLTVAISDVMVMHCVLALSSSSTNLALMPRFAGPPNVSVENPKVRDLPAVARRNPIISRRRLSPEQALCRSRGSVIFVTQSGFIEFSMTWSTNCGEGGTRRRLCLSTKGPMALMASICSWAGITPASLLALYHSTSSWIAA